MTDDPDNPTGLERMLCFDLYAANHAFARFYKPLLDPLGLTYPQYLVMVALWAQAPLSVGRIGQRLGLASNTLTPLLKRLALAGLVQRSRDTDDERRVTVSLTPPGLALRAQAESIPICVAQATGMTAEELEAMQDSLRRLNEALMREAPDL